MNGANALSTRPPIPLVHVAKGLMRVVDSPSVLRATVGGEFVVAIWFPGSAVGGMAHLRKSPFAANGGGETIQSIQAFLNTFLNQLREIRPLNTTAVAVIGGGADLIGICPEHSESELVVNQADYLSTWLSTRRIEVRDVDSGGRQGRIISLYTDTGRVKIERLPVVAGGRAAAPEVQQRMLAVAEEDTEPRETTVGLSEIRVERSPHRLTVVLGSCVGIALYDPTTRIGALSHTMMPTSRGENEPPGRFVDTAIPALIEKVVAAGADRKHLQAKLVGGARVLIQNEGVSCFQIAEQNVRLSQQMLTQAGIPILERRVGGNCGFKATMELSSFKMHVRLLGNARVVP